MYIHIYTKRSIFISFIISVCKLTWWCTVTVNVNMNENVDVCKHFHFQQNGNDKIQIATNWRVYTLAGCMESKDENVPPKHQINSAQICSSFNLYSKQQMSQRCEHLNVNGR